MPFPLTGSEINAFAIGAQPMNGAEQYAVVNAPPVSWDVLTIMSVTKRLRWVVTKPAPLVQHAPSWDVLLMSLADQAAAWDLRSELSGNQTLVWDVVGQVTVGKRINWQMQTGDRTPARAILRQTPPTIGV